MASEKLKNYPDIFRHCRHTSNLTHLTQKKLAGMLSPPLLYSYPLLCINNDQGKENKEQSCAAVLLVDGWPLATHFCHLGN